MNGKGAGFGFWDWLVLVGYFVSCTAFGLWVSRKVRTSGGYFLGERKLPWWIMIGQAFGTGHPRRKPRGSDRGHLPPRFRHDLVPVEEPPGHTLLLADGPLVPPQRADHHGRDHR